MPELTESCDVDGLGHLHFLSKGKKIEQGGGKLGKHLEEGFREGPSNTMTKQLSQPPPCSYLCLPFLSLGPGGIEEACRVRNIIKERELEVKRNCGECESYKKIKRTDKKRKHEPTKLISVCKKELIWGHRKRLHVNVWSLNVIFSNKDSKVS